MDLDTLRGNYLIVPIAAVISGVYFYLLGDAKTYQQKQKLQSDTVKNVMFISVIAAFIVYIHTSDPNFIINGIDAVRSGVEDFTPGPPSF